MLMPLLGTRRMREAPVEEFPGAFDDFEIEDFSGCNFWIILSNILLCFFVIVIDTLSIIEDTFNTTAVLMTSGLLVFEIFVIQAVIVAARHRRQFYDRWQTARGLREVHAELPQTNIIAVNTASPV